MSFITELKSLSLSFLQNIRLLRSYFFEYLNFLSNYFYQIAFDNNFVRFDRAVFLCQTLTASHVETPAVKVAFDYVSFETGICHRVSLMRTKVFDRVKIPFDIKKRDFAPILKFHRRAASRRNRIFSPDSYLFPCSLRFAFVFVKFSHLKF